MPASLKSKRKPVKKTTAKRVTTRKSVTRSRAKKPSRLHKLLRLNRRSSGFTKKKFLLFIVVFVALAGGYLAYRSFADTTLTGANGEFTALTPARILDTRDGTGGIVGAVGQSPVSVQITGRGGVPASNVKAVIMNVTTTGGTAASDLEIWPSGQSNPKVSDLNFSAGQTIANQVTVMVGTGGKVQVYNSSGKAHVIFDVAGYISDVNGPRGSRFFTVSPQRVLDTRTGLGGYSTPSGPNVLRSVQVGGLAGVPTDAKAVVMNATVTNPTAASNLTVWPSGEPEPVASNLNYVTGQTIPNQVTVKIGPDGRVNFANVAGNANVIFDVEGYYEDVGAANAASQEGRFVPVQPMRIYDTRGGSTPAVGQTPYSFTLSPNPGGSIPYRNVSAVVMNVTSVNSTAASNLTIWPSGTTKPGTSSLNFLAGQAIPNQVTALLGADGKINMASAAGKTDVIVDIAGYYIDKELSTGFQSSFYGGSGYRSTISKFEYDFKPTAFSNAKIQRIDLPTASSFNIVSAYLDSKGNATISMGCAPMSTSQCKVLASDGTEGTSNSNYIGLSISVPYKFSLNKTYRISEEVLTDQPGYPGQWRKISITADGIKKDLINLAVIPQTIMSPYTSITAYQEEYSCNTTTPLSWTMGNYALDSTPVTDMLDGNLTAGFNWGNPVDCKGYTKATYDKSSGVLVGTYTIGVPKAQRDTTPPVITAVTRDGYNNSYVHVTANDPSQIADARIYTSQPNGYPPAWGSLYGMVKNPDNSYTATLFSSPAPAGQHSWVVITDGSGNQTQQDVQ